MAHANKSHNGKLWELAMFARNSAAGRVLAATAVMSLAACGVLEEDIFAPNPDDYVNLDGVGGGASSTGTNGTGTGSTGSGSTGTGTGDLPCDVAAVLAQQCDKCHAVAIPPMLRTHAEFMAASKNDSSKNLAEMSLIRMQDGADPMPPDGTPPTADVQVFADWVAAGAPKGNCGGVGGMGPNPFDVDPVCTSGKMWTKGDHGSSKMLPGRACNKCHAKEEPEKVYGFAGTVYPTAHEPNNCYGVGSDVATVEVTDANGVVRTATTNSAGNFRRSGNIAFPATVRVLSNGQELKMVSPLQQGDGDCNLCHTQDGTENAPGRIILPY